MDSPAVENRPHHSPEFLQSVAPHSIKPFRSGDMTHADAFDFLLLLGREVECVAQKDICAPPVTWIARNDGIQSLGEPNLLHQQKCALRTRRSNLSPSWQTATVTFHPVIRQI